MSYTIKQGESLVWAVGPTPLQDLTIGTWECEFGLFTKDGKLVMRRTTTTLDANNNNFIPHFTPEETASLTPGTYSLVSQVVRTDSTPPLNKELCVELNVNKQFL